MEAPHSVLFYRAATSNSIEKPRQLPKNVLLRSEPKVAWGPPAPNAISDSKISSLQSPTSSADLERHEPMVGADVR